MSGISQRISQERKSKVFEWLDTPPQMKTQTRSELRKELHMSYNLWRDVEAAWKSDRASDAYKEHKTKRIRAIMKKSLALGDDVVVITPKEAEPVIIEEDYDSTKWLSERTAQADEALLKSLKAGSPASLKLFYDLLNRLVEKKEVTHKLDGGWLARELIAARRELEDSGMVEVPIKSPPLPDGVLLSSGQSTDKDIKV